MKVFRTENGGLIKALVDGVQLEDSALAQLKNVADLSFIYKHVAVMPDVHAGMGATIGSVVPTIGAIIPAAVGVDIGCGMLAAKTGLRREDVPGDIRARIEHAVPHGRTNNGGEGDRGAWGTVPSYVEASKFFLDRDFIKSAPTPLTDRWSERYMHQLGTLGTGNHFIELSEDETGEVWIVIHSGSRGVGNAIGQYFIRAAKELMKQYFIELPDPDLAYIPQSNPLFGQYMASAAWAQMYARLSRFLMYRAVCSTLGIKTRLPVIDCHHNYVAEEKHFGRRVFVTRKGATRAGIGDVGVIPGSMGTPTYIVKGKGDKNSFESCSHGAGRVCSRNEARKTITVEQHKAATAGIDCRKDEDILDESPAAYKPIDKVMEAQKDLVDIVHTLKQFVNVKG